MSVSWLVGWLAVGGGWAVRVVESAESSGAVGSAAVDARALGLQEDVSESRSSTETGDGRWKDVPRLGWWSWNWSWRLDAQGAAQDVRPERHLK